MNIGELKKTAVRGAGINVTLNSAGFILHTAGVIVLTRLLSPKDFGLVAMVSAFSMWLMNFGFNGFIEYIVQKKDISIQEINAIFWMHILIAFALSIIFVASRGFLVRFYGEPEVSRITSVMAGSIIIYACYTCHSALLQRDMKFAITAVAGFVATIISVVLSIAAALNGLGYWAVVIRQMSLPTAYGISLWLICPWRPECPKELWRAIPALKYAIKVYSNFTLNYLTRNIDKTLLGRFHGSVMLGNYDRGYHLSQMAATQLLVPISGIALSAMSRLRNDERQYVSYYVKTVSFISFLGTLVSLLMMLGAQDIVLLLLGPEWDETGRILMVLSPAIGATLVSRTAGWIHLSLGRPDRWLRWNIVAAIFMICVFFIGVAYGAVGMGIAYSVGTYILLFPSLWYAGRPVGLGFKNVFQSTWPHFISGSTIACTWFLAASDWMGQTDLSYKEIILRIICVVLVGAAFYLIMVAIMERSFKSVRTVISLGRILLGRSEKKF